MDEAFNVMVASGDAGDELQPINDKDERFDNLLMDIVRKDVKVHFIFLLLANR
jgi:hypothetical protein